MGRLAPSSHTDVYLEVLETSAFRKIYFQNEGVNDTAHLNAKGHDRFLPCAEAFLLQY